MANSTYAVDPLLTRREAAEYLGVAEQTLAVWATAKRYDLPYLKIGARVKYRLSDLDAWMESRQVTSTSDAV